MVKLPERLILSLPAAAKWVAETTGTAVSDAQAAIKGAGIDGQIWSEGLSEGPRVAEKSRKHVPEQSWRRGPIDWEKSTIGEFEEVEIERSSLRAWLQTPSNDHIVPQSEPARRRGRRPEYDWASFNQEVARIVGTHPDGYPEVQADLERQMADWCTRVWGENGCPSESTIRERVAKHYSKGR